MGNLKEQQGVLVATKISLQNLMLALLVLLKFQIVLSAPKKMNRLSVPNVEAALAF